MNKRIFWTAAALLTAALGAPLASHAQQNSEQSTSPPIKPAQGFAGGGSGDSRAPAQPVDAIKVGEYQSTTNQANDAVIARIQTRTVDASHQVATLYVRNIPVLTFVGHSSVATSGKKFGAIGEDGGADSSTLAQVATIGKLPTLSLHKEVESDPVWRASLVAAKLNQLSRDNLDASKVTVNWQTGDKTQAQKSDGRYLIEVNGKELVEINADTQLADTTKDRAKDALQATNRLRRLLGNAPPLHEIAGRPTPKLPKQIALGPIRISLNGWASWYGPEFQGNLSASGEVFNQNALTAAHRTLPFGTQVRVTNMNNGRSVVVRINDRGPYIQGRIIDLSTAAAQVLGLMETGVAPVRLDVLR
ncbi:MAG: septal ring lytic transglycosylase RlpA family protein [Chroococcidiopsidaceae cyanobacterium CP_BM_RX_35]|nr:septal ring lytic transglycosylase RlpA family protein [Chroococcidiopsidaceae cyanobacterium CP_BM_RX_35]